MALGLPVRCNVADAWHKMLVVYSRKTLTIKQMAHPPPDGPFWASDNRFDQTHTLEWEKVLFNICRHVFKVGNSFPNQQAECKRVEKVLIREVTPRWGIPWKVSRDNGPTFVSKAIANLDTQFGHGPGMARHTFSTIDLHGNAPKSQNKFESLWGPFCKTNELGVDRY